MNSIIDFSIRNFLHYNVLKEWWFLSINLFIVGVVFITILKKISFNKKDYVSKYYGEKLSTKQFNIYLLFFGLAFPLTEILLEMYDIRPYTSLFGLTIFSIVILTLFHFKQKNVFLKKYFKLIFKFLFILLVLYTFIKFYKNSNELLPFAELMLVFVFASNVFLKIKQYFVFVVIFTSILVAFLLLIS